MSQLEEINLVLYCNFCGATISDEDKSCRTCGTAVSKAPVGVAVAAGSQPTRPLREWGTVSSTQHPMPALRQWEEPIDALDSRPEIEAPTRPKRSYSRLRVYLLAAVVAALIVVAYMVVAGGDSGGRSSAANQDNAPGGAATSTGLPTDESIEESAADPLEPDTSASESQEPSVESTPAGEQGTNSLTLTFDPPPSPTVAPVGPTN